MLRAFVLGIYFIGCIVLGVAVSSASAGTEPMRTRSWKDAGSWEDEHSEGEVRYDMNGRVVMTWQSRRRRTGAGAMLEALEPAGFDLGRVPDVAAGFDTTGMRQEEIVNLGFKGLVLDAFAEAPGFELGK